MKKGRRKFILYDKRATARRAALSESQTGFHYFSFSKIMESTTPLGGVFLIKRNRFIKNQYHKA